MIFLYQLAPVGSFLILNNKGLAKRESWPDRQIVRGARRAPRREMTCGAWRGERGSASGSRRCASAGGRSLWGKTSGRESGDARRSSRPARHAALIWAGRRESHEGSLANPKEAEYLPLMRNFIKARLWLGTGAGARIKLTEPAIQRAYLDTLPNGP